MLECEQNKDSSKLILNLRSSSHVQIDKVVMVESFVNYTKFYMNDGKKKVASRTLKFYELRLQNFGFVRVHRSFMINPIYVQNYDEGSGTITMTHGCKALVSRRKKKGLENQNF
jgi:DNA-binding LytR/AlgR family response regulator